jgi:hypothetical protein
MSVLRHRKFVYGAMYEVMFPGYLEVTAMKSDYDLVVTLPSNKESVVRIRQVSSVDSINTNEDLLGSLVELGKILSDHRQGNCRGSRVGDVGSMHAMGVRSFKTNVFYKMDDIVCSKVQPAARGMAKWLGKYMPEVLAEIRRKDSDRNVVSPDCLVDGPGSRMVVSVNLGNSPHYDVGDTSVSVAVWVEEKPGHARNWFFVLPNVSYNGSRGIAIKLEHGMVISWDGREIYHCSSKAEPGHHNNVYGCMWGSCSDV